MIETVRGETFTPVAGGLITVLFAGLLLVAALLWHRYTVRYQEWIAARLSGVRSASPDEDGSVRRRFSPTFVQNSGTIVLLLFAAYTFILGIRELIG